MTIDDDGYDASGRISEVSVDGIAAPFQYGYMTGTDLQSALAMPNGVTRQTAYDPMRGQPVSVTHTNAAGAVLARRTYGYDPAGRLTNRTQHRLGDETNRLDAFGYNPRSELTSAALGTNAYAFDPIGNRTVTTENTETTEYLANGLNQYSQISVPSVFSVVNPTYDLDGKGKHMRRSKKRWLSIVVTCSSFLFLGCSDSELVLKENEIQETKMQTKISSVLLKLEKSRDEVARIQTAQILFNILTENQDKSSLNHKNALEIMSYLKDENDGVRYWIALSLSYFGAYADEIVPELLSSLDEKVAEYSSLSSSDAILISLKKIAPSWRKRADVTKRVLERWPKD